MPSVSAASVCLSARNLSAITMLSFPYQGTVQLQDIVSYDNPGVKLQRHISTKYNALAIHFNFIYTSNFSVSSSTTRGQCATTQIALRNLRLR